MGNCLYPVENLSLDKNGTQFTFDSWNYSFEDNYSYELSSDYSLTPAAPCYSCNLLGRSSLPFFMLTSVLGMLASGGILFAILRPFFHWQICPSWPILAELAVGSALFSIAVPILAPGLHSAHSTALCNLGYWRHGSFEVHALCHLFYHLHCIATDSFGSQGAEDSTEQGAWPLG
uniref:Atypical chemokine receptor 1 n=1 Tax=Mus musculus TaxID=10090 RepID=A0A0A6YWZ3_MOUSE